MVVINGKNNEEDLEKLSNFCPEKLCFSYTQKPVYINLIDWYWLFRINNVIYDELDLYYLPFIKHDMNFPIRREAKSIEMFQIDFSNISNDINIIEIGLNNMRRTISNPMSEIQEYIIQMYELNKDSFTLWNEFSFCNGHANRRLYGKQLLVGTFARVDSNWRFFPQMISLQEEWNSSLQNFI